MNTSHREGDRSALLGAGAEGSEDVVCAGAAAMPNSMAHPVSRPPKLDRRKCMVYPPHQPRFQMKVSEGFRNIPAGTVAFRFPGWLPRGPSELACTKVFHNIGSCVPQCRDKQSPSPFSQFAAGDHSHMRRFALAKKMGPDAWGALSKLSDMNLDAGPAFRTDTSCGRVAGKPSRTLRIWALPRVCFPDRGGLQPQF